MDIFILSSTEGTSWDAHTFQMGAFSTEEGAKLAADQSAEGSLRWEKGDSDHPWFGYYSGDDEGAFFFLERMRLQ